MDLKSSRSEIHGFRYPNQPATYLSLGVILGLFLNLLDELLGFGAFLILQTKCLILGEARERALAGDQTSHWNHELIAIANPNGNRNAALRLVNQNKPHTFSDHLPRPLSLSSLAPASC